MLAATVSLHDILDCEMFVQATVNQARLVLSPDERDELVCEGLAILQRLARDYQPGFGGRDAAGSTFSGMAAQFLPRKLGDAWHRMHPEHLLTTQPDGRRKWVYRDRAVHLEAMTDDELNRQSALRADDGEQEGMWSTLHAALLDRAREEADLAYRFAVLIGEGRSDAEAARILQIRTVDAHACAERVRRVAHKIGLEAT